MITEIRVGDVVRAGSDRKQYRVTARNPRTGMLSLESLHSMNRVTWIGVHEFHVTKVGAFS